MKHYLCDGGLTNVGITTPVLTSEDIAALDEAGAAGWSSKASTVKTVLRRLAYVALTAATAREIFKYFEFSLL